jgi:hypothetical protein
MTAPSLSPEQVEAHPHAVDLTALGIERHTPRKVHRSELKNAPYNPREMSDAARANLRNVLDPSGVGLIQGPVWNRRSGNIVGGHQRMRALDSIAKTRDYFLWVSEVDLSEAAEIEANLALNNEDAQGEWELEKFAALLRREDVRKQAAGFDGSTLYRLLGEEADEKALEEVAEKIEALKGADDAVQNASRDAHSTEFYAVLVWPSAAARAAALKALGLDDVREQDGERVIAAARALGQADGSERRDADAERVTSQS